jgi:HEPN domain-containing protein
MRPPDHPDVRAWLDKAQRDLWMAELAMSDPRGLWDQVCFHSQQAAEKALKGLLIALELEVPRTRDLGYLLSRVLQPCPALGGIDEQAELRAQYGVAARYPGEVPDPLPDEATAALAAGRAIVDRVARALQGS